MTDEHITIHRVTDDPEQHRVLVDKFFTLGTFGLAAYAHSLGLYPPAHQEGQRHSISQVWILEDDRESDGTLIWGTSNLGDDCEQSADVVSSGP